MPRLPVFSARLLGGLALFIAVVLLTAPLPAQDEKADRDLKQLVTRMDDPKADREKLRVDLVAFRRKFGGTTASIKAAQMLSSLPSPLDRLDPKRIAVSEQFPWQPKELVAVLGEHKMRHGSAVSAVAVSPDGKTAYSVGANLLRSWDTATMRPKVLAGVSNYGVALALSKDGKTLATGHQHGTVELWDVSGETFKLLARMQPASSAIYGVALSPDGKTLAAGGVDTQVRLWELPISAEKKEKYILNGHTKPITCLAFTPDGRTLYSGSADETARGWDMTTKEEPKSRWELEGNTGGISSLGIAPDGRTMACGCTDGSIRLWNLAGDVKPSPRPVLKGHKGSISGVAFSPDSRGLASSSADKSLRLWNILVSPPRERAVLESIPNGLPGHQDPVSSVAWFPNGQSVLSGSQDWSVRQWNVALAKPAQKFDPTKGHLSHAYSATFSPDSQSAASGALDRTVRLWTVNQPEAKERSLLGFHGRNQVPYSVAYHPDGKTVAAGGNTTIVQVYDAVLGRELRQLKDHPTNVGQVAYTPDGRFLLASSGKSVLVWEGNKAVELRRLDGHETPIIGLAVSPDGKLAASTSGAYEYKDGKPVFKDGKQVYIDCVVRLWDIEEGIAKHVMKSFTTPVYSSAFTMDAKRVLSTAYLEQMTRLLDLAGEQPKEIDSPIRFAGGYLRTLQYSPDGRYLATLGPDASIVIWDAVTGKPTRKISLPETVPSISWASDSRHLLATLATGPVYVLRLASPPAVSTAAR